MLVPVSGVIAQSDKEGYLKSYISLAEKGLLPVRKGAIGKAPAKIDYQVLFS